MTELETKTSPISKWVESTKYPLVPNDPIYDLEKDRVIRDYEVRIGETKRKIAELSDKLEAVILRGGLRHPVWMTNLHHIWGAVDVYTVECMDGQSNTSWSGVYRMSLSRAVSPNWMDYFGDQSIRQTGGHIVVMLSDEGTRYLNDIAKEVLTRFSLYDTNRNENVDEPVEQWPSGRDILNGLPGLPLDIPAIQPIPMTPTGQVFYVDYKYANSSDDSE